MTFSHDFDITLFPWKFKKFMKNPKSNFKKESFRQNNVPGKWQVILQWRLQVPKDGSHDKQLFNVESSMEKRENWKGKKKQQNGSAFIRNRASGRFKILLWGSKNKNKKA